MHGSMGSRPSVDPTRLKPVHARNSVESRAGGEKKPRYKRIQTKEASRAYGVPTKPSGYHGEPRG